MKKILTIIFSLALVTTLSNTAYAQIDVGGGLVLGSGAFNNSTVDNSLGLRAEGRYAINEEFSAGADLTFFFPKEESNVKVSLFAINMNAFYNFYSNEDITAYAIGGLNIGIATVKVPETTFGGQTYGGKSSNTEVGLNLGAGAEYGLDFGQLFGELKFAGVGGDADEFVVAAGIRVPFGT
jgi:opacity protein-like surface antigen